MKLLKKNLNFLAKAKIYVSKRESICLQITIRAKEITIIKTIGVKEIVSVFAKLCRVKESTNVWQALIRAKENTVFHVNKDNYCFTKIKGSNPC